jgi:hypothetical protein
MRSFKYYANRKDGKIHKVDEVVRKVHYDTHVIYLPRGTSYTYPTHSTVEIGRQKIEGLAPVVDPESYSTIYVPVNGTWEAKTRIKQAPESLTTMKDSFKIAQYAGNPFQVDPKFWDHDYILGMLEKEPSLIELVRDLGLTFIEAELIVDRARLPSPFADHYPKSKDQDTRKIKQGGTILKVRDAISSWLSSPDTFIVLLESSFIVYEAPIDISYFMQVDPRDKQRPYRFIINCLQPLTQTCKNRGLMLKFECDYPYGATDLLPVDVLVGKPKGGSPKLLEAAFMSADYLYAAAMRGLRLGWLANKKVIYIWSKEEECSLDNFLFGVDESGKDCEGSDRDCGGDKSWYKDYLDPKDVPEYVVRYITRYPKSVVRLLLNCPYTYDGLQVLSALRKHYLWHYAERVAEAMTYTKIFDRSNETAQLYPVFPKIIPANMRNATLSFKPCGCDEPGLVLPAISASRPERHLDWSLDFSKSWYKGTDFELLARPHETTREHYALMISSLPIGNIRGLDSADLGWTPAADGKPTTKEWTNFLDHFYEITAPRRTLASIPVEDRTYSVCEYYSNRSAKARLCVAELTLIPSAILWRLAAESPYDARYVSLDLLYQPDKQLADLLATEPGYLATLLERVHGGDESPVLKDPFLVTKLCYMGAAINSLALVPAQFRSPGICDAYWRVNPSNLEFIPLAMRTLSMV